MGGGLPSNIGPYEVIRELGRGGMGVVYLAHDPGLNRKVAIKALPEDLAKQEDRLSRFKREARFLASLNHPNIASVFGIEYGSNGEMYLVMEFVEGQDLATMLHRGPLAVEEAVNVCMQVASGVEAAHEAGVIHRDLKPGNIIVTSNGIVKVLDFGLAKEDTSSSGMTRPASATGSIIAPVTGGRIVGTAGYLSPEQARGKPVDKRTDIFAFGCVLYECLTGRLAFPGETAADMLVAIIEREPELNALPRRTPPRIRDLLVHCFQKDPRQRLRDIGDARIELERAKSGREWSESSHSGLSSREFGLDEVEYRRNVIRWSFFVPPVPRSHGRGSPAPPQLAISPNGRLIVFGGPEARSGSSGSDGRAGGMLYVRSLDEFDPRPISGTEHAEHPAFSPDGRWLAFVVGDQLRKVPAGGGHGAPLTLYRIPPEQRVHGLTWCEQGIILAVDGVLARLPQDGGHMETVARSAGAHLATPEALPDGASILCTCCDGGSVAETRVVAMALGEDGANGGPAEGPTERLLLERARHARFLPSGHLVYVSESALLVAAFDPDTLTLTGAGVPVVESVHTCASTGASAYAVSPNGTLVFAGAMPPPQHELVWLDREDKLEPVVNEANHFVSARLSPDGLRMIAVTLEGLTPTLWMYDLQRGGGRRLTSGRQCRSPVWSRDSKRVLYAAACAGTWGIFSQSLDLSGPAPGHHSSSAGDRPELAPLIADEDMKLPCDISPDGRSLLFCRIKSQSVSEIHRLALDGERVAEPIVASGFNNGAARFSPDGRWIAFESDESGVFEVYVQDAEDASKRWQVSTDGGYHPLWNTGRRELFFISDQRLMRVEYASGPTFRVSRPRVFFENADRRLGLGHDPEPGVDITPDGRQFLLRRLDRTQHTQEIRVVLNWLDELRQQVPSSTRM